MTHRSHIERILLVAGASDTGKSTQLRSMFLDPRLGTGGEIPTARNLPDTYGLSPSRQLYIRLMSPHEADKTLKQFLDEIAAKTAVGRWCIASAIQTDAGGWGDVPDLPTVVEAINARFSPERIRIALLSPDCNGNLLHDVDGHLTELRRVAEVVEVMCIDARTREGNGLLLADTFDFA